MLNYEFPPIGGGTGIANYQLLKEFSKNTNLEIDLVTSGSKGFEIEHLSEKIRVFKLGIRKQELHFWRMSEIVSWTWKAYWFSKKLVFESRYDVCHCWSGWPSGVIGYLFRKRVPYIIGLRGSDVPGYNERIRLLDMLVFKFLSRVIWRNARAVTALSDNLRKLAYRTFKEKNIKIIYNGIDTSIFGSGIEAPKSDIQIVFVGRLIKRKGVIDLLKAFKEVSDLYSDCKLTIVGEGPERTRLENYCRQARLDSKVNFLGAVPHEEISTVYQKASIFVLPSLAESLGNVIQEAIASGLPVITTNTGAAELLDENGFIVEKGDYIQIKKAIMEYIGDPELIRIHSKRSREIADKMTWDNAAEAYLEIYNGIIW